jgi:hypothetical protein
MVSSFRRVTSAYPRLVAYSRWGQTFLKILLSRPDRRCLTTGPDLGGQWPSRLVATTTADWLNIKKPARPQCGAVRNVCCDVSALRGAVFKFSPARCHRRNQPSLALVGQHCLMRSARPAQFRRPPNSNRPRPLSRQRCAGHHLSQQFNHLDHSVGANQLSQSSTSQLPHRRLSVARCKTLPFFSLKLS